MTAISGTMLTPGVSRNGRLYTKDLISKAVTRARARLADPKGLPITMRSHHEAGDDSTHIVGRITDVSQADDGSARFKAELADTTNGRDIAKLISGTSPMLRSVSIHGYWVGDTRQVPTESGTATTADDLEIDSVDFTASPGVDGAVLDSRTRAAESADGRRRTPIIESMDVLPSKRVQEHNAGGADGGEGMTLTEFARQYDFPIYAVAEQHAAQTPAADELPVRGYDPALAARLWETGWPSPATRPASESPQESVQEPPQKPVQARTWPKYSDEWHKDQILAEAAARLRTAVPATPMEALAESVRQSDPETLKAIATLEARREQQAFVWRQPVTAEEWLNGDDGVYRSPLRDV